MTSTTATKTVRDAAVHRVSIRKYTDQPISEELMNEILDTAGRAPSPWNVQPWRVTVVRDAEMKQKLMGAAYGQPQVGAATAVLVVASDMKDAVDHAEDFVHPGMADRTAELAQSTRDMFGKMGDEKSDEWGFAESNIFLGYLLLALESHGIGSSPMLGFDPAQVRELLGMHDRVRIPALVAIGYPAEAGFPQFRHPLSRWTKTV
ncbi:MAG: nitroreductase family protein [Chthonomonas sp.]|nr:nitroreductase family protein [Chthonomonas sp.]